MIENTISGEGQLYIKGSEIGRVWFDITKFNDGRAKWADGILKPIDFELRTAIGEGTIWTDNGNSFTVVGSFVNGVFHVKAGADFFAVERF